MVPRLLKKVFGFPFRIVRRALQLWTPSQPEILPVGGLTPEASSELLFALRQAATTAEVRRCGAHPSEMVLSVCSERFCHGTIQRDMLYSGVHAG